MHTDNNPLTYVLTTAKLDAAIHHWVTSLANYNFRLHYRAGKTNIDADALSRESWPECMPDNLGTHLKVNAAAIRAIQEAALDQPACHRGLQLQLACHRGNSGQSTGSPNDPGCLVASTKSGPCLEYNYKEAKRGDA